MLALNLCADELGEVMYLAYLAAHEDGNATPLWVNLEPAERLQWNRAAERILRLYQSEGLTLGALTD